MTTPISANGPREDTILGSSPPEQQVSTSVKKQGIPSASGDNSESSDHLSQPAFVDSITSSQQTLVPDDHYDVPKGDQGPEQAQEASCSQQTQSKDGVLGSPAMEPRSDLDRESFRDEEEIHDDKDSSAALEDRIQEAPRALKQFSEYMQRMEERMRYLEEKCQKLEAHEEPVELSQEPKKPDESVEPEEAETKTKSDRKPAIPELRYVKWGDFKNKYADDQEVYAIEVLVGSARYWYQKREDDWTRRLRVRNDQATVADIESGIHTSPKPQEEPPERIRINSEPLIAILSNICGEDWLMEPKVLQRPYKHLVHYDSQIRDVFSKLQSKWASHVTIPASDSATQDRSDVNHEALGEDIPDEAANGADRIRDGLDSATARDVPSNVDNVQEESDDVVGSLEALRDMSCLIDFMDEHLTPLIEEFQNCSRKYVRFHELWYLFKAGDIIYSPLKSQQVRSDTGGIAPSSTSSMQKGRYQTAFRVCHVDGGRPRLRPIIGVSVNSQDQPPLKDRINSFDISSYYIDYNGQNFGPVGYSVSIQPFEGEREITSLEAYPLAYAEHRATIYNDLRTRGHKFKSVLNRKHMLYIGSTYTNSPNGSTVETDYNLLAEHLNSEVIIDFAEAGKIDVPWIYDITLKWLEDQIVVTRYPEEYEEEYPVTIWKDRDQKDRDSTDRETILSDDTIDMRRDRIHATTDAFLKTVAEIESDFGESTHEVFRDEDIILLPSRVLGYVFRERRFAMLNVQGLRPLLRSQDGFKDLKLPSGHKEMVQALVRSHSMRKHIDADTKDSIDHDVVRGKGRGLIILLHGVPGVGKTSTAECVAESTRKPLFPITCGDLGLTPQEVEGSLRNIFHLAQVWDCVLLLDEADVFLAQRTKTDLKRNALVSVFLRVLEYYTGILFLTTNRVGAFDEAFKSRIHISLYYPTLAKPQSLRIWEMNLERTKKIDLERTKTQTIPDLIIDDDEIKQYAEIHWTENLNGPGKWNGRQIRNAFQTASALALYEAHMENKKRLDQNPDAEPMPPHLKRKHFEKVARATRQFDQYMEETIGRDDADAAHIRGDRTDAFRPKAHRKQQASPQAYGQSYPTPATPQTYGQPYPTHVGPQPYGQPYGAPALQPYTDSQPSSHRPASRLHHPPPRVIRPESPTPGSYVEQADFVEFHAQTAWTTERNQASSGFDDDDYADEYE